MILSMSAMLRAPSVLKARPLGLSPLPTTRSGWPALAAHLRKVSTSASLCGWKKRLRHKESRQCLVVSSLRARSWVLMIRHACAGMYVGTGVVRTACPAAAPLQLCACALNMLQYMPFRAC